MIAHQSLSGSLPAPIVVEAARNRVMVSSACSHSNVGTRVWVNPRKMSSIRGGLSARSWIVLAGTRKWHFMDRCSGIFEVDEAYVESPLSDWIFENGRPMSGYSLQPHESFVHRQERIRYGGTLANFSDELILTSHNLVLVEKRVFGGNKGVRVFPLSQVKVFQGAAQALVGKHRSGHHSLDVYFQGGTEQFVFMRRKDVHFWAEKINEVITGVQSGRVASSASSMEKLAGSMKNTVGAFRVAFGAADGAAGAPGGDSVAAVSCNGCGAPLSGVQGQVVVCSYCDGATQL